MIGNKIVDLPYNDDNSEDLLQYFYSKYYNYTQYLSFQMSSWGTDKYDPWGSANVLFNPSRNTELDHAEGSWCSKNRENSFLILKLQHIIIKIRNYEIGQNNRYNRYLFKHWRVDGSIDGRKWFELGKESFNETDPFINVSCKKTFETKNELVKFIKFTQIGQNTEPTYSFIIGSIKVYGEVFYYNEESIKTCKTQSYYFHYLNLFTFIII